MVPGTEGKGGGGEGRAALLTAGCAMSCDAGWAAAPLAGIRDPYWSSDWGGSVNDFRMVPEAPPGAAAGGLETSGGLSWRWVWNHQCGRTGKDNVPHQRAPIWQCGLQCARSGQTHAALRRLLQDTRRSPDRGGEVSLEPAISEDTPYVTGGNLSNSCHMGVTATNYWKTIGRHNRLCMECLQNKAP